ncbi:hypothetical protein ABIC09_006742 [Bradyrhizobium sp. S3.12.5]|uniref:hypothetical protein n=1 Tax=Bradyrhizobium sp. S3.12.5 TaxID=3156386 RepID=UPI003399404C
MPEYGCAEAPRLLHRLARVLDGEAPFVVIDIVRLAVGEQDQQPLGLLASAWDRKLAKDLAQEIEVCTGDRRETFAEMRRFLAVKGYRELLPRLWEARAKRIAEDAMIAIARAMRSYALERPPLSAASFWTAAGFPEWHQVDRSLHALMTVVLAECGLCGEAVENALSC